MSRKQFNRLKIQMGEAPPCMLAVPFTSAEETIYWFYHGWRYKDQKSAWLRLAA